MNASTSTARSRRWSNADDGRVGIRRVLTCGTCCCVSPASSRICHFPVPRGRQPGSRCPPSCEGGRNRPGWRHGYSRALVLQARQHLARGGREYHACGQVLHDAGQHRPRPAHHGCHGAEDHGCDRHEGDAERLSWLNQQREACPADHPSCTRPGAACMIQPATRVRFPVINAIPMTTMTPPAPTWTTRPARDSRRSRPSRNGR